MSGNRSRSLYGRTPSGRRFPQRIVCKNIKSYVPCTFHMTHVLLDHVLDLVLGFYPIPDPIPRFEKKNKLSIGSGIGYWRVLGQVLGKSPIPIQYQNPISNQYPIPILNTSAVKRRAPLYAIIRIKLYWPWSRLWFLKSLKGSMFARNASWWQCQGQVAWSNCATSIIWSTLRAKLKLSLHTLVL